MSSGPYQSLRTVGRHPRILANRKSQIAFAVNLSKPHPRLDSAQKRRARGEDCPTRLSVGQPAFQCVQLPASPGDGGDGVPVSAGQLRPRGTAGWARARGAVREEGAAWSRVLRETQFR